MKEEGLLNLESWKRFFMKESSLLNLVSWKEGSLSNPLDSWNEADPQSYINIKPSLPGALERE